MMLRLLSRERESKKVHHYFDCTITNYDVCQLGYTRSKKKSVSWPEWFPTDIPNAYFILCRSDLIEAIESSVVKSRFFVALPL